MHITITGNLGSGKSTVCRILQERYGYEIYSTGKIQRQLAAELGISVLEMNERMCHDRSYDTMIDNTTTRISKENPDKRLVFDSRMAWHFAQPSFKIFLSLSLDEAARRVFHDDRGSVETYASIEEARQMLLARTNNENERFRTIYQSDYFDFHNYNLILDTSCETPDALAARIIEELAAYEAHTGFYAAHSTKALLCTKRLLADSAAQSANPLSATEGENMLVVDGAHWTFTVISGGARLTEAAQNNEAFVCAALA